jgi:hypothetical protein
MANVVAFDVYQGEDRTLTLNLRDSSNAPMSLTGATISFRVGKNPFRLADSWPIFTKTGSITDSDDGVCTVPVVSTDTQYMAGDYAYQAWVTISGQATVGALGRFRVRPWIESGS